MKSKKIEGRKKRCQTNTLNITFAEGWGGNKRKRAPAKTKK